MIFVEMDGRLGNQLFRYAAAKAFQLKYYPKEKIILDFNKVYAYKDASFENSLKNYNINFIEEYSKKEKLIVNETSLLQKIIAFPYYITLRNIPSIHMNKTMKYQNKWKNILNYIGIYRYNIGYVELTPSSFKNKILSGTFEDPKYFEDIREVLLKEFTPRFDRLEKNKNLYKIIEENNSVCVSVRRGDYESNEENKKLHSVCNKEYFEKAIEEIKKRVENPVIILFSDEIEWAKKNITTDCETYYEDGADPVWEKLRMMSLCKHFIISNSTFSWWAQWLSENNNKIIVSPNRWYNNDYKSPLINPSWILIDVK